MLFNGRQFLGQLDYIGAYVGQQISNLQINYERTGLQDATLKRATTDILNVHVYGEVRKAIKIGPNGQYRITYL